MARNLLAHLRLLDDDQLRQIAERWEVVLTGRSAADNVAQLYRTLRDPWLVRIQITSLSATAWAVIEELLQATAEAGLSLAALSALLPQLAAHDVAAAVDDLRASGILTMTEEQFALPRELATALRRIQEEFLLGPTISARTPLRALLTTLEGGELEESAQAWGVRVTPGTIGRDDLIDEILARVDLPEQRRAITRDLHPVARQALQHLRAAHGQQHLTDLTAVLGCPLPVLRDALRVLHRRLLVWPLWVLPADSAALPTLAFVAPHDLIAPRRPPRDAPPDLVPVAATGRKRPHYQYGVAWDLLTLLQQLERRVLDWREGDEERNATALRRLAPALWGTADDGRIPTGYIPLLLALADDLGLVRLTEERYETIPVALEQWRNRTFASQTQTLFNHWRTAGEWLEGLSQDDLQLANVDWTLARLALLRELRRCPVGSWFDLDQLALRIARLQPELLGGSFNAARASGPAGTREEVTAAAVTVILLGALIPLGLLAGGDYPVGKRSAVAVALTPVGAWLLGDGAEPTALPLADQALTVGADFEIALFQPVPRRVWALNAIADLVRLDTATIYRLTESSVRRGIASGFTREQLVGLLERGGRAPLPQNVAYTVQGWLQDYAAVRLARAVVLRLDDETLAARLEAALQQAKNPPLEPLPDGRFLLTLSGEGDAGPVLAALREAGFTPHWLR